MKTFFSILKREFKRFFGNKIMVILYLGGPLLYGMIFGLVYHKGKLTDVPIIVVDNDHSVMSQKLLDMLDVTDLLSVKNVYHSITNTNKIFVGDSVYAMVVIPQYFERDIYKNVHPEVNTYINNSNMLVGNFVTRSLNGVFATFNAERANTSGKKAEVFHLNTFRLFNPSSSYFMFIWPSYLAIVFQSVIMVVLALSFASETEQSSWSELYTIGKKHLFLIMMAKVCTYFLLSILVLLLYNGYFYLFREPFPEHPFEIGALFLSFWMTNAFIGMIAGLLFRSQLRCLQFLMILSMPIYISSGFSWPYDQSGAIVHFFSNLFPFMPFVNAFRILLIEKGRLSDVTDFIQIQFFQVLCYGIVAYVLLWYKKNKYLLVETGK